MSRIVWISAAALALLLGATGVSLATQGPANNASPLVLNLLSRATAINDFVDTGSAGPSPGDLYVFTDRLFLASAPDVQVGTTDGRCALIDPVTFKADCSFTNVLTGVDLLAHGSNNMHGWGQQPQLDPNLFFVRGFDPATNTFKYDVNPRFGNSRLQTTARNARRRNRRPRTA